MVRLVQAARAKGKDLKLSGLSPYVRKTLQMTSLISQFETHESVEEAITAAYLGPRYSRGEKTSRRSCAFTIPSICARFFARCCPAPDITRLLPATSAMPACF